MRWNGANRHFLKRRVWSWRSETQDCGDFLLWFQSFGQLVCKARGPAVCAGMTGKLRHRGGFSKLAGVSGLCSLKGWLEPTINCWDCVLSLPQLLLARLPKQCESCDFQRSDAGKILWTPPGGNIFLKVLSLLLSWVYSGEIVAAIVIVLCLSRCLCFCQPLSLYLSVSLSHTHTLHRGFLSQHNQKPTFWAIETENPVEAHWANEGKWLVTITFIAFMNSLEVNCLDVTK